MSQRFHQIEDQTVVITAGPVGRADPVLIPHAGPVRHIAPLDIHPLGTAVPAVEADAQPNGVRALLGEALRRVHELPADAPAAVVLQHAEVHDLRPG